MDNKFVRLNIAIKPPSPIAKKIIELSKSISNNDNPQFVLDGANFLPHATLYSPEFPFQNVPSLYRDLEELAGETSPFLSPFTAFQGKKGYLGIGIEKTPQLMKLHTEIVKNLNPLREGHLREKYHTDTYRAEQTPEQLHNIDTYGYPAIFNLFNPHLTIIRFEDVSVANRLIRDLEWETTSMLIGTLGVYNMGKNGTCTKLLRQFQLG